LAFLADLGTTFLLGLATPLTALCVLPLYPGFLSFLISKIKEKGKKPMKPFTLGLVVTGGVLAFMILLGILFTTIFEISLTDVIFIVSPIAFGILAIISLALIFNFNIGRFIPKVHAPIVQNPISSAFLFGFFFGAIVIPCNPAFIAFFFARQTVMSAQFLPSMLNFISFGIGIAFPLLVFSIISEKASAKIISFLGKHGRAINLVTGIIMFVVSIYYLFFVFKIIG